MIGQKAFEQGGVDILVNPRRLAGGGDWGNAGTQMLLRHREKLAVDVVKSIAVARGDGKTPDREAKCARHTFAIVVYAPVIEERAAASRQYVNGMASLRKPGGQLPRVSLRPTTQVWTK